MYPWSWNWNFSPNFHLPLGGSVAQDIRPYTWWFFEGIRSAAGNSHIERQAFDVASYGKQLGMILEVLLPLAENAKESNVLVDLKIPADKGAPYGKTEIKQEKVLKSLAKLGQIYAEIEAVKERDRFAVVGRARDDLEDLCQRYPETLKNLLEEFQRKVKAKDCKAGDSSESE